MTFEHELRDRLRHEANSVALPGRDPASAARRSVALRRRRQLGAAAMVAVSAAAILGVPLLLANEDSKTADVTSVGTPGLPETGPIEFDYQSNGQGLLYPNALFQDSGGTVYGLSTEPGRPPDDDWSNRPRAVYSLGEDGTWQPLLLGELRAIDLSGNDGLLYAVSTGPAEGSATTAAYLSTSDDGGENWTSEIVDPPGLPSDAVTWTPDAYVSVETSGDTTLALVSYSFYPQAEELFDELKGDGSENYTYLVDERGITLEKFEWDAEAEAAIEASGEPTTVPADPDPEAAEAADAAADEIIALPGRGADTEVRTIPWSDLGVENFAETTQRQIFRRTGDGWEPLSVDFGAYSGVELGRAGGRFVASGYSPDGGARVDAFVSDDGSNWAPISAPQAGRILGVGDALVNVPSFDFGAPVDGDEVIQYSVDGGSEWSAITLDDIGVEPGWMVYSADGGPLGLALAVGPVNEEGGAGPQKIFFSGDLQSWTSTDLVEQTGIEDISGVRLLVGEDRLVATVESFRMSQTATVVGTPVR